MPVSVAEGDRITARNPEPEVCDRIATEIIPKVVVSPLARRLNAVILQPVDLSAERPQMGPDLSANDHGVAETVRSTIDRNTGIRPESLIRRSNIHLGAHGIWLRYKQRVNSIEPEGHVYGRRFAEQVGPRDARAV